MKKFNTLAELAAIQGQFPEKDEQPIEDYKLLTATEIRREFEIRQCRRRKSKKYSETWIEIYSHIHQRSERITCAKEVAAIPGEQGGVITHTKLKQKKPTAEQVADFYWVHDPKKPKIVTKYESRIKWREYFNRRIYTIGDGGSGSEREYEQAIQAEKQCEKLLAKDKQAYEKALAIHKEQIKSAKKENEAIVSFLRTILK